MIRIVAPHFVAGVVVSPRRCAPIVKYMRSWDYIRIINYCRSKGWHTEYL